MSDFLLLQTPLGISKAPETTYNQLKTLQADFVTALTQQLEVKIPILGKISDAGLIGSGHGYTISHTNEYFSQPSITFSDRLNTSLFAIYLARMLGGTITDTVVTASASYDHVIEMLAPLADPQMKSSTIAVKAGGMDFILGGMVGSSFSVSFSDAQSPTFKAEFMGSGKFDYMSTQTPALTMPAVLAQDYMGVSAGAQCSFNDGTLLALHSIGRLKGLTINFSNNPIMNDRRTGDAFRVPGDIDSGAVVTRLTRDVATASVDLSLYVDENKREWADHLNNTSITDFKYLAQGKKIGVTTDRYEVEFTLPKGVFTNVDLTQENNKHVMNLTLTPELKSGEVSLIKARVRNGTATLA